MEARMQKNKIEIKKSSVHGYGVFATQHIASGEVIEECPVILVNKKNNIDLSLYLFRWNSEESNISALALGFGSLYNHTKNPNTFYEKNYTEQTITFRASQTIQPGEELLTHYGNDWFKTNGVKEKGANSEVRDNLIFFGQVLLIFAIIVFIWLVLK